MLSTPADRENLIWTRLAENSPGRQSWVHCNNPPGTVPKGRLRIAQDVSPGYTAIPTRRVPKGRLRIAQDVSPGYTAIPTRKSPEGSAENSPGRQSWVHCNTHPEESRRVG